MFRSCVSALRRGGGSAALSSAAPARTSATNLVEQSSWFSRRREGGVESAANLQFINISLRSHEVKSCNVSASTQQDFCDQNSDTTTTIDAITSPDDESLARMILDRNSTNVIAYPVVIVTSNPKNRGDSEACEVQHEQEQKERVCRVVAEQEEREMGEGGSVSRFGDPSGGELLRATQPLKSNNRRKGQWGTPFFGKVWHQPRNFAYATSKSWHKKFYMKKHRYTKRWRKRRYKLAALANLPFAKKLRVDMIPRLQQGKKKAPSEAASAALDTFSIDAQELVASAVQGKTKSGVKTRFRPKSKYQV